MGRHVPPEAEVLTKFLERFAFFYDPAKQHGVRPLVDVAAAVTAEVSHLRMGIGPALAGELAFLDEDNISNRSAVENLIEMGKRGRALFVNYDFDNPLALADELPGVTVRALGPPTLEQSDAIKKMKSLDAAEFWQLSAAAGRPVVKAGEPLFPEFAARSVSLLSPPHTRWFVRRMNAIRGSRLLEIVRILDSVMNNTSAILLFEVGGRNCCSRGMRRSRTGLTR